MVAHEEESASSVPDVVRPYVHTVRYHEVDQQRHVYHSRYLEIADAGFSDYLAELFGTPYSALIDQGFDPAVVSIKIEFCAPARYEDRLTVVVKPTTVGRTSFQVLIMVTRVSDGTLVARLTSVYANFDVETSAAREIPSRMSDLLRAVIVE